MRYSIEYMRLSLLYFAVFLVLLPGCKSSPGAEGADPLPGKTPPKTGGVAGKPVTGNPEYEQTLAEVKQFIENLNGIIAGKNYSAWSNSLSDEYFARISSPEYLAIQSETPLLTTRRIVLKSPNDYFLQVVVPSRANSQVDEIEIAGDNAVSAYFTDNRPGKGRLRMYELRKIGNNWKIVE
jgi:hypothetical protein